VKEMAGEGLMPFACPDSEEECMLEALEKEGIETVPMEEGQWA
jgi:hypothetical protein